MAKDTEDLDSVFHASRELEMLISTATPKPDLTSERRARLLCQAMRGTNGVIDDSIDEIEKLLPIFFSLIRHATYPGGPEGVRDRIGRQLVPRIRIRLEVLRRTPPDSR